LNSFVISPF